MVILSRVAAEKPSSKSSVIGPGFEPLIESQPSVPSVPVNTTEPVASDGVPTTVAACPGAFFDGGCGMVATQVVWSVQSSIFFAVGVGVTGPELSEEGLLPTSFH